MEAYPQLEGQIVHIASPFKNLKYPVLRRTVGKLATLAQVAQVGGMDAGRLVNTFEPTPILDTMRKQNRRVFHKVVAGNPSVHYTFIR